jgi:uncharacterized CHY-type Zn-finger protein
MKKEYDVYICDGDTEHRTLVERDASWDDTAMEAIVCPVCKEVAGYEGYIRLDIPWESLKK